MAELGSRVSLSNQSADGDGQQAGTNDIVQARAMLFNGVGFDRQRGNYQTEITADEVALTATANGQTQTNFNARGFIIVVQVTVNSGTPTLALQLQYSPDGGTTWLNLGPATSTVNTTSNTIALAVYPAGWQENLENGGTAAGIHLGATANKAINGVLPRTWRLQYVVAGSTPNITPSKVWVEYIV